MRKAAGAAGLSLWSVAAGAGPTVCVVDFARFGQVTTLAELLGTDAGDHSVYRLDPVGDFANAEARVTLAELADRYAELLAEGGVQPDILASYCSTASLALHLNGSLRRLAKAVVLVEPTWPTDALVVREARDIRRSLGVAEPEDSRALSAEPVDIASVMAVLRADLRSWLSADPGSGEDAEFMLSTLAVRYEAWLTFLLECSRAPVPPPPPGVRLVLSPDGGYAPSPTWSSRVPTTVIECPHDELLEHSNVRALVRELERQLTLGDCVDSDVCAR